jgi:hypothetical protein
LGLSGQVDVCADHYLWMAAPNYTDTSGAPSFCKKFNASTLDYFSQAQAFVRTVSETYPGYSILLTGHSLGAGLSAMVANWPNVTNGPCPTPRVAGALVFAAPDYLFALRMRTRGLNFSSTSAHAVAVVADAFDPVFANPFYRVFEGMIGERALWTTNQTGIPSAACERCVTIEHAADSQSLSCLVCMSERHVFKHYEDLVRSGARPDCIATVNLCSHSSSCGSLECHGNCC